MLLALQIARGHSADMVLIDNVVVYQKLDNEGTYAVTYEDPNANNKLFDIYIKHVTEIKEVH